MTKFKEGFSVTVDDCYLNDEVTLNINTSKIATIYADSSDDESDLVSIQYQSGQIDFVPRDILTLNDFYYDIHVDIPKNGYSIGLKTNFELNDIDEVISEIIKQNKFEERGDSSFVDFFEEISEEEFIEWYGNSPKLILTPTFSI
jgi:hypothetical protein